jgi:hypothetical protein
VATEQLVTPQVVLRKRVTGRDDENGFKHEEENVEPAERQRWTKAHAVADVRDRQGDAFVGIRQIVTIMNLDEQSERFDVWS